MHFPNQRAVVILGAGASAEYGGPLVNRFLDATERCISTHEDYLDKPLVWSAISARNALRRVQADIKLDVDNIEDLLTSVDTAEILDKQLLPEISPTQLADLFREAIARTVEQTVKLTFYRPESSGCPLQMLHSRLEQVHGQGNISYVTFNYDCSLEVAMLNMDREVTYEAPTSKSQVPVYKLHGSVNWFESAGQASVVQVSPDEYYGSMTYSIQNDEEIRSARVYFERSYPRDASPGRRLIVAPTFMKSYANPFIRQLWSHASNAINEAKHLYVIGYSMPNSDAAFRHLLGVSNLDGEFFNSVTVVRPFPLNQRDDVRRHYEGYFGQSLAQRLNLQRRGLLSYALYRLPPAKRFPYSISGAGSLGTDVDARDSDE
jgi:hypothetical protein